MSRALAGIAFAVAAGACADLLGPEFDYEPLLGDWFGHYQLAEGEGHYPPLGDVENVYFCFSLTDFDNEISETGEAWGSGTTQIDGGDLNVDLDHGGSVSLSALTDAGEIAEGLYHLQLPRFQMNGPRIGDGRLESSLYGEYRWSNTGFFSFQRPVRFEKRTGQVMVVYAVQSTDHSVQVSYRDTGGLVTRSVTTPFRAVVFLNRGDRAEVSVSGSGAWMESVIAGNCLTRRLRQTVGPTSHSIDWTTE